MNIYPDLPSTRPSAPGQTNYIIATTKDFMDAEKEKQSPNQLEIHGKNTVHSV